ncbi:MAG TPA: methyltransferase domain-containing protein, partial [Xanthobacteraceae bacterium]|nr:methyltransferase domain-containing protein [Xanthobacteraceae bacterium]
RGATVIGIDFSATMIAEAQKRNPDVEFREGDAEHLPFGNDLVDAAVVNFGILHLARPDQALAEACRVVCPGGRFGFTVWAKPEETLGFGIVLGAIAKYGDLNVPLPEGPPFFRFSEPDECIRSLLAAGFQSPTVVKVAQVWRLPSVDSLFEFMKDSTVRTAGLLRAQKPEVLEQIRDAMRDESKQHQKGGAVELPMPAILSSAVKP